MWQAGDGPLDHGGPCKLVRSWVELYPEGDELLEVEVIKFIKF